MRRAALFPIAIALALASCNTRAPAPAASGSQTGSPSVRPSATATKKPTHVVSARQALYVFQSSIWLYDVKTNKARQLTQGGTVSMPKWIDANHFSFVKRAETR